MSADPKTRANYAMLAKIAASHGITVVKAAEIILDAASRGILAAGAAKIIPEVLVRQLRGNDRSA
jgi:hypothetical protein